MFWAFGRALHCISFAEKAKKDAVLIPPMFVIVNIQAVF